MRWGVRKGSKQHLKEKEFIYLFIYCPKGTEDRDKGQRQETEQEGEEKGRICHTLCYTSE